MTNFKESASDVSSLRELCQEVLPSFWSSRDGVEILLSDDQPRSFSRDGYLEFSFFPRGGERTTRGGCRWECYRLAFEIQLRTGEERARVLHSPALWSYNNAWWRCVFVVFFVERGADGDDDDADAVSASGVAELVPDDDYGQSGAAADAGLLFRCRICWKGFKHPMSLTLHKDLHTGQTRCPICQRIFSRSYDMKAHLLRIHKHTFSVFDIQSNFRKWWHDSPLLSRASFPGSSIGSLAAVSRKVDHYARYLIVARRYFNDRFLALFIAELFVSIYFKRLKYLNNES